MRRLDVRPDSGEVVILSVQPNSLRSGLGQLDGAALNPNFVGTGVRFRKHDVRLVGPIEVAPPIGVAVDCHLQGVIVVVRSFEHFGVIVRVHRATIAPYGDKCKRWQPYGTPYPGASSDSVEKFCQHSGEMDSHG